MKLNGWQKRLLPGKYNIKCEYNSHPHTQTFACFLFEIHTHTYIYKCVYIDIHIDTHTSYIYILTFFIFPLYAYSDLCISHTLGSENGRPDFLVKTTPHCSGRSKIQFLYNS